MRTTRNKLVVATAATALVLGGAGVGVAQASNGNNGHNGHNNGAGKSTSRGASTSAARSSTGVAQSNHDDKNDDGEGRAHGRGANRARAAALVITEGGKANSVERDNENGATWEVEVTKANGDTVDVRLNAQFKKVVIERDSEANDAQDDAGDE